MKRLLALLLATIALSAAPARAELPGVDAIYQVLSDYLARRPSQGYTQQFDLKESLVVQRAFLAALEPELGRPVGYKVALVSRDMQERFNTTQPVRGVLLDKMLVPDNAEVPPRFGANLLLEADLIVVVKDKAINKATTQLQVLKHLSEAVAFIELPDSFISTNFPMDAAKLTAVNVGARLGVLGQRLPLKANQKYLDALAGMRVTISDDTGATLGVAQGLSILDHPLNAVLWLIEDLKASGQSLQPGDMLSLGSLAMIRAPAGRTVTVRYEGLPGGKIQASVRFK